MSVAAGLAHVMMEHLSTPISTNPEVTETGSNRVVVGNAADRPVRKRRIAVKEEDLEELYLLVQGAPYANTVLDAKTCLAQKDYEATLALIESARDRYRQSNKRILRQVIQGDEPPKEAQRKTRQLKQKQDRCNSVLEAFDDLISVLGRMIKLRAGGKSASEPAAPITTEQLLRQGSAFRVEYETARSARVQLAVLRRYFDVKGVTSQQDMVADELYFLRGKELTYLIQLRDVSDECDELPVQLALSGQMMQPISRAKFLAMGQRNTLVWLVPKGEGVSDESNELQQVLETSVTNVSAAETHGTEILDIGSFSQLHDAAKRSGLVPNVDLIAHVRDREFRCGDYQKAFQVIEGVHGKFAAASMQRAQRLRREDVDIASGKLRMSTKDLLEKRARDIAENQLVERARIRFTRVLEGLRVLMKGD